MKKGALLSQSKKSHSPSPTLCNIINKTHFYHNWPFRNFETRNPPLWWTSIGTIQKHLLAHVLRDFESNMDWPSETSTWASEGKSHKCSFRHKLWSLTIKKLDENWNAIKMGREGWTSGEKQQTESNQSGTKHAESTKSVIGRSLMTVLFGS